MRFFIESYLTQGDALWSLLLNCVSEYIINRIIENQEGFKWYGTRRASSLC